ncbi:MAG: flagellar basal body-associated FliL family protein [Magnetococcales bacterium]|nr:flagellar basal body-associated FliL family protein [Magnetococcales bacterium]
MAEEAEQEPQEEAGGGGGGGGGIVKILIMAVPALLIGAGGGYFFGSRTVKTEVKEAVQKEPQPEKSVKSPTEMVGDVYKLEPFVVNLNEPRGNRYLKTTIQLEMGESVQPKAGEKKEEKKEEGKEGEKGGLKATPLKEEIDRRQPQIRDIILQLLTSKSTQELQAFDGKFKLREEILGRLNAILVNGQITSVYFTEFVIQ